MCAFVKCVRWCTYISCMPVKTTFTHMHTHTHTLVVCAVLIVHVKLKGENILLKIQ